MTVRRILQIDNAEDKTFLKRKSVRVKQFDKNLRALVDDMVETMRSEEGVGLAAPQVGVLHRIVVIETPPESEELEDGTIREIAPAKLYVLINPEISEPSEEQYTMLEGCLSLPGWYGEVPRPAEVTIRYQDLQGKEHKLKRTDARGYTVGRIAQHEVDHLDGILFMERIEDLRTFYDRRKERAPRRRRFLRRRTHEEVPLPE